METATVTPECALEVGAADEFLVCVATVGDSAAIEAELRTEDECCCSGGFECCC